MDWTGGTRRRFAGTKTTDSALQKQKAHFARARAATQREPAVDWLHRPFSGGLKAKRPSLAGSSRHRPDSSLRVSHPRASQRGRAIAHNDDTRTYSPKVHNARSPDAQPASTIKTKPGKVDEELLLLANRRRLLARSDWLALDPARPLRLEFPVTADDDRVGRRKKIKKATAKNAKPAQQRLLAPLFEERLDENDFVMSGALPPPHEEQIEVKVGTGAFDSQSHPSRRSMMSDKAPQSTAFSHLSEESMLLGADGDTFDAEKVEIPALEYKHMSQGMATDMESSEHEIHSPSPRGGSIQLSRNDTCSHGGDAGYGQETVLAQREPTEGISVADYLRTLPAEVPHGPYEDDANSTPASESFDLEGSLSPSHTNAAMLLDNRVSHDSEAEKTWKDLMGIATQFNSSTSNKALYSSSQHLTNSDTVPRANLTRRLDEFGLDNVTSPTPRRGHAALEADVFGPYHQPARGQSPSANSDTAVPLAQQAHSIQNNEALWREFIIGSQDSESEDELHLTWQRNRTANRNNRSSPQSLQVSGLGTSDKATQGDPAPVISSALFVMRGAGADDDDDDDYGDAF